VCTYRIKADLLIRGSDESAPEKEKTRSMSVANKHFSGAEVHSFQTSDSGSSPVGSFNSGFTISMQFDSGVKPGGTPTMG